jgi:hypothetical protein
MPVTPDFCDDGLLTLDGANQFIKVHPTALQKRTQLCVCIQQLQQEILNGNRITAPTGDVVPRSLQRGLTKGAQASLPVFHTQLLV